MSEIEQWIAMLVSVCVRCLHGLFSLPHSTVCNASSHDPTRNSFYLRTLNIWTIKWLARYTTDVIATRAFRIEFNNMKNSNVDGRAILENLKCSHRFPA